MKVIHWTKDKNFQPRPICIKNGYEGDGLPDKPLGGLWCSPANSKYNWKEWCKAEGLGDIEQDMEYILDISEEGMLVIDSEDDLYKLPVTIKHRSMKYINFRELLRRGYKSIWLTEEGVWNTRLTYPLSLYSWDCETVLIMDESIVTHYEEANNET